MQIDLETRFGLFTKTDSYRTITNYRLGLNRALNR